MWPVKPSPKWPIMCRVGRKTLLYHTAAVSETMQERWRSFWAHLVMFILVLRGSCQLSSELRAFYIVSWSYCACAWRLRTTSSVLQCIMNRTLAADAQHTASCAVERDDRNNKVIADCYSPDYILQVRRPVYRRIALIPPRQPAAVVLCIYYADDKRLLPHRTAPVASQQRLLYASFGSEAVADELRPSRVYRATFWA